MLCCGVHIEPSLVWGDFQQAPVVSCSPLQVTFYVDFVHEAKLEVTMPEGVTDGSLQDVIDESIESEG